MSTTYNALASAIMQEENSTYPNNPGAIMGANGPLDFGSFANGVAALKNKLAYDASGASKVYSPNMTLGQFEGVYTGGDPNAGNNVASMLGVPVSTPLGQLSDQSLGSGYSLPSIGGQPGLTIPGTGASVDIGANGDVTLTTPQGSQTANAAGQSLWSMVPAYVADVVAVLVGLVLIAGAVFSFSQVKDTVVNVAKGAAVAA